MDIVEIRRSIETDDSPAGGRARSVSAALDEINTSLLELESSDSSEEYLLKIRYKLALIKGVLVFGDIKRYLKWLDKTSSYLDSATPRSLIGSASGLHRVLNELARIEYS